MKVCSRCGELKGPRDFYERGVGWCRPCTRTYVMAWRKRHPHMHRAHRAVQGAIRSGRLKRAARCERCRAKGYTVAHHESYRRPLDVTWLCDTCHAVRHVELGRRIPRRAKKEE